MTQTASDEARRSLGAQAGLALDAVESAVWDRSVEIMKRAEGLLEVGDLDPTRSQALLISLLEQRRLAEALRGQIKDGVRAAHRLDAKINREAEVKATEERAQLHGRNRFGRSKVPQSPDAA